MRGATQHGWSGVDILVPAAGPGVAEGSRRLLAYYRNPFGLEADFVRYATDTGLLTADEPPPQKS